MKQTTVLAAAVLALTSVAVQAQSSASSSKNLPDAPIVQPLTGSDVPLEAQPHPQPTVALLPQFFLSDAVHIVTAPAYIRTRDLKWLLPLAGASATAFATDTTTMKDVVSRDPGFNNTAVNASNLLVGGFVAAPAALFVIGHVTDNEHARETGFLGGEAMIDAAIFGEATKLIGSRERPLADNAQGEFFTSSAIANPSFISEHSVVTWSSAAVLAAEYPTWWKQAGIYTVASGLSLTRVLGQEHFPSDVLIGSATGWLIGHYVFRAHHHWSQLRSR